MHESAPHIPDVKPGEVLVIWNRYYDRDLLAERFEAAGGTVLVAENGYVRGRHHGGTHYAVAVHGHNGSGTWPVGGPERWELLGVPLQPRKTGGGCLLVAPNRPFGMRGTVMPSNWAEDVARRLRGHTKLALRIRPHPGNSAPAIPLDQDLGDACAVAIWSSSVGVHALIAGIPVLCEAPYWVCKDAAASTFEYLFDDRDWDERRQQALHRLAWAQWSIEEIGRGDPFRHLLRTA